MKYVKHMRFYQAMILLLTVVGCIVQTVLLITSYDSGVMLYRSGTPDYVVVIICVIAWIVAGTALFFLPSAGTFNGDVHSTLEDVAPSSPPDSTFSVGEDGMELSDMAPSDTPSDELTEVVCEVTDGTTSISSQAVQTQADFESPSPEVLPIDALSSALPSSGESESEAVAESQTVSEHSDCADTSTSAAGLGFASWTVRIGALLVAVGTLISGLVLMCGNLLGDHFAELLGNSSSGTVALSATLLKVSVYVGILAMIDPIWILLRGKGSVGGGMATTLWFLLLDLSTYFDSTAIMNDPCRALDLFGFSAAILWMTYETRRRLGRASYRGYAVLSMGMGTVTAVSSLPRLIATAAGTLPLTSRTLVTVALFGVSLMCFGRLLDGENLLVGFKLQMGSETSGTAAETSSFSLKDAIRQTASAPDTDLFSFAYEDEEEDGDLFSDADEEEMISADSAENEGDSAKLQE